MLSRLQPIKMTKRMQVIPPVILILALLAACTAQLAPLTPETTAPITTGTAGLKVIPFFTTESDPDQLAVLQDLIQEYQQENPGVEVDIVLASPSSRGNRLLTALASGADLGIFEVEPTLMPQWVDAGYLLPLDDITRAIGEQDFLPGGVFHQAGHVYAVPYAISVYGLWLRKDLFEKAGLALPENFDQLLTAAKILTHGYTYGIALPAGQNIATVNYFSMFLWQNGGDYFSCQGDVAFGEPESLVAIKRWAALAQFAPPGFTTWGYREQIDAFLNGRVAMAVYGGRLGVQLYQTNPDLANKVTVIFPPLGPDKVTLGVWSRFAIAAGTKNKAEARAFLQWLVSGERLKRYDMTLPGHMIPPLISVRAETLKGDSPYARAHADWIRSFYEWSDFTNHPAMNMGSMHGGKFQRSDAVPPWAWDVFGQTGILDTMLQEIALGTRAPEPSWQEAVSQIGAVVTRWKSAHPGWKAQGCQ